MNDQLNEDDVLFLHYVKHCDPTGEPTLADAKARLMGRFESEYEFGRHCWRERGWLNHIPDREAGYIDFRSWVDHAVNSGLFVIGDTFLGVEADIWVWKPSL